MDKYLPKFKQGEEGLIVNICSIAATEGYGSIPIYCGTKHAVLGLTKSWGNPRFYGDDNIRMISLCPGVTMTPLITECSGRNLGEKYERLLDVLEVLPLQQ